MNTSEIIKYKYNEEVLRVFPNAKTTHIAIVIKALKAQFGINVVKKCIKKDGVRYYYHTSEVGYDSAVVKGSGKKLIDSRKAYVASILMKCKPSNYRPAAVRDKTYHDRQLETYKNSELI